MIGFIAIWVALPSMLLAQQYAIDPRLPYRVLLPGQLAGLSIYDRGRYDEFKTKAGYYEQLAELIGGWEKIEQLSPEEYDQAIKDAEKLSKNEEKLLAAAQDRFSAADLANSVAGIPCAAGILSGDQNAALKKGETVVLTLDQRAKLQQCYASTTPAWSFDSTISYIQPALPDLDPAPLNNPAIPIDGVTIVGTVTPALDFLIPTTTTYPPINPLNPFLPRNALDDLWYPDASIKTKGCFKLLDGPYDHPRFPKGFYFDNCGRAIPAEYFTDKAVNTAPPTPAPPPTEPPTTPVPTTTITFPPGFIFGTKATKAPEGPDVIRTGDGTFVDPDTFKRLLRLLSQK